MYEYKKVMFKKKRKYAKPRSTTKCGECGNIYIVDDRVDTCERCGKFLHELEICEDCSWCLCRCGFAGIKVVDSM